MKAMIELANKDFNIIIINMLKDLKENVNRMRRDGRFLETKKYNILNKNFTYWDLYQIKHCRRKYQSTSTHSNRIEAICPKAHREKKTRKKIRAFGHVTISKHSNVCVIGISEGEEKGWSEGKHCRKSS